MILVLNSDKCLFMLLGIDDKLQTDLVFRKETFKSSKQEQVLDVTIDNKLKFARHSANITKNANSKFNGLKKVKKYVNTE